MNDSRRLLALERMKQMKQDFDFVLFLLSGQTEIEIDKDSNYTIVRDIALQEIAKFCHVTVQDMKSNKRKLEMVTARHHFMCYMRETYPLVSLATIGEEIGNDHAMVLHALTKLRNAEDIKSSYYFDYLEICDRIHQALTSKTKSNLMSNIGDYPLGADQDPKAPWHEKDLGTKKCDKCDGEGFIKGQRCTECFGEGIVEKTEEDLYEEFLQAKENDTDNNY